MKKAFVFGGIFIYLITQSFSQLCFPIIGTNQSLSYNQSTSISAPTQGTDYYGQNAQYPGRTPRVNAIDYILKPLDYATFLKSAQKAKHYLELKSLQSDKVNANDQYIFIKSENKTV